MVCTEAVQGHNLQLVDDVIIHTVYILKGLLPDKLKLLTSYYKYL